MKKRILSALLVLFLLITSLPIQAFAAEVVASGYCGGEGDGTNLSWTLDSEGTLTISGSGRMQLYSDSYGTHNTLAPWHFRSGSIKKLIIGDSVTSIGGYAFYDCTNLASVSIGNGVTAIVQAAFKDCTSLTTVNIGNSVREIYRDVFKGCTSLTSVTIPDTVKSIGYGAFSGCSSLTSVVIPDSVTGINTEAFEDCRNLTGVYITDLASWCKIRFGATFSGHIEGANPLYYANNLYLNGTLVTELTIPDSVTSIGNYAFTRCTSLTSVVIPNSVTTIGWGAFRICTGLTSVYFEGNAPTVNVSDTFYKPFYKTTTLYYIPGTTGWTDSAAYDAAAGTWNGYKLATWTGRSNPEALYIEPISTEPVVVNGRGTAQVWFQLSDYEKKPIAGKLVNFTFGTDRGGSAVTDGNGLFAITLTNVTKELSDTVTFAVSDFDGELVGATGNVTVSAKPFSFSQSWSGSLGVDIEGSIGAGAGIGIGVADLEATAAEAAAKAGVNGQLAVKNEYDSGVRTLELTYTYDISTGVKFKSGIDGTIVSQEIEAIGASAGVKALNQTDIGLKLEGYDPANLSHLTDVGLFALQTGLIGQNSVWATQILDWIDVGAHNQVGYTNKLIVDAGAHAGKIKVNEDQSFELAGLGADAVIGYTKSADHTDQTEEQKLELEMNYGAGFLKKLVPGTDGYAFGAEDSNAMEIAAKFASDDTPLSLTYKLYDGGKKNIWWATPATEYVNEISFGTEEIQKMAEADETMRGFVQRKTPVLAPVQMVSSVFAAAQGDYRGTTTHEVNEKKGIDLSFPFKLKYVVGLEVDLSGSYVEEFSYEDAAGIYAYGKTLETSRSEVSINEIEARKTTLSQLLKEPVDTVSTAVSEWLNTTWGNIKDGVSNAWSEVTGTVEGWVAEIKSAVAGETFAVRSYAVLAVAEEEVLDTDAAVAVTVGDPYLVNVYSDESRTELVSDEALAANPLTITLGYTAEMLSAAGAGADADLHIYWFDAERNLYVCLDSIQDKGSMTVSAPAAKHGEYILATDNASPLISDFAVSDQTTDPTITVLVSDLSGIKEFSFRLDGVELVNEIALDKYYDTVTGVFTYDCEGLAAGEHTAEFEAADFLGNANAEPFAFTFTVDAEAPVITEVTVPTEPVSEGDSFTVIAEAADNDKLASVVIKVISGEQNWSAPMTETDGVWNGEVTGIAGLTEVDVSVVATDYAGNRSESAAKTVSVTVPAKPTGLEVATSEVSDGEVTVAVSNYDSSAMSGWLVCAAYDEDGKMIATEGVYVGLKGYESQESTLRFNCDARKIAEIKTFFMDVAEGYSPII